MKQQCYPSMAPDSWYIANGLDVNKALKLQLKLEAEVDRYNKNLKKVKGQLLSTLDRVLG